MMKKLMMLILALVLCVPAFAQGDTDIPVKITAPANGHISLEAAINTALQELPAQPEQYQTRAELVRMSDENARWIVTVFDLTSLTDAWCVEIDAFSGEVLVSYTTYDGFFQDVYDRWTEQKGLHALWSLEDKQLYDTLYVMMPAYGLPVPGDLSAEDALKKALAALGLTSTDGYEVGYGYLKGAEDVNGAWEVCLVQNGQIVYQVNLDAVTGDIYYMIPDEAGNG